MSQKAIEVLEAFIQSNAEAVSTGASFEYHLRKKKNKKGRPFKKAGEFLKKAAKKAKDFAIDATLTPLLPFKKTMKNQLKREGVASPPDDISELASLFYQRVLQKKKNYEVDNTLTYEVANVDPVVTPMIIGAILQFFKTILDAKAKGQATGEQKSIAADIEADTAPIAEADSPGALKSMTASIGLEGMTPLLIIAAVLFFVMKKKK